MSIGTNLEYGYFLNRLILHTTTFKINDIAYQFSNIADRKQCVNYQAHQQVFVELFHIQNITLYILLGILRSGLEDLLELEVKFSCL